MDKDNKPRGNVLISINFLNPSASTLNIHPLHENNPKYKNENIGIIIDNQNSVWLVSGFASMVNNFLRPNVSLPTLSEYRFKVRYLIPHTVKIIIAMHIIYTIIG
ncbi:hypothetical protein GWI89_00005 [Proteus sp. G4417]|nr:hypothetical protein [Proteus sp. G4417]